MSVKDVRLALPGGMHYRLLVLPPTVKMTPATLRKVCALAKAGATIVATTRVNQSPSLQNHPACDQEVQAMARELFGDLTAPAANGLTERKCGAGRVFLTGDLPAVLATIHTKPDIEFTSAHKDFRLGWIHRHLDEAELYFIANQNARYEEIGGTFRVAGRQPELWHPETGRIGDLPDFSMENGRTRVPLRLGPNESVFIVFRKLARPGQPSTPGRNWSVFEPLQEIRGPWKVTFDPHWGGPATPIAFDTLADWSQHSNSGIKYFSGTAIYRKEFDFPAVPAANGKSSIVLDLGRVEVMADVKLNGQELGTLWKPPFRVDVTNCLKPGRNRLEVRVVNLWCNRLIGDQQLRDDADWCTGGFMAGGGQFRLLKSWPQWLLAGKPSPTGHLTFSTVRYQEKNDPLLPSGLLGPVTLQAVSSPVKTRGPGFHEGHREYSRPPDLENVGYGPHQRNVLDLWKAKSDRPTPLVVYFHPGGFGHGDKRGAVTGLSPVLLHLCLAKGISVAAANYRYSWQAPYPAQLEDSARVVQFLRYRAQDWNLNPKAVAATGSSAGAIISMWLAFRDDMADPKSDDPVKRQSTRLSVVGVSNGQTSCDPRAIAKLIDEETGRHMAWRQLFGLRKDEDILKAAAAYPLFEDASAINHLKAHAPPVLHVLLHTPEASDA